ncbi:MAG: hypothetical protein CMH83_12475 [Nocardioides sp.]|nr:hypothetical protein [Nocardioides sp.]
MDQPPPPPPYRPDGLQQPPSYGPQGAPLPPGTAWVDLTVQGSMLTSSPVTPTVLLNGWVVPARYGANRFPVPPGPCRVEASNQWLRRYGQAHLDFHAGPGQVVPVFYASPYHQFSRGAMGHVRQQRPGVLGLVLLVLAMVAVVALVVAAIALPVG